MYKFPVSGQFSSQRDIYLCFWSHMWRTGIISVYARLFLHIVTDLRGIYISDILFQRSLERRKRDKMGRISGADRQNLEVKTLP